MTYEQARKELDGFAIVAMGQNGSKYFIEIGNCGRKCDKVRKFYAANATEQCARAAAWAKANPEAVRLIGHRRRARITGAGGSFTAEQFKALGDRCLCCGRTEAELAQLGLMLVPDHVLPIARGGSNNISNIQPLCHAYRKGTRSGCNNRKHAKHIDYRGKQCTL